MSGASQISRPHHSLRGYLRQASREREQPYPSFKGGSFDTARSVMPTRRKPTATSYPDIPAPPLLCPTCSRPLVYRLTVYRRGKPIDRQDYFDCRQCGPFEFRHRTHTIQGIDRRPREEDLGE